MLNTVVGSAIGGLVAGAVALGAAATVKPAPAFDSDSNGGAYAMPVANTAAFNNGAGLRCQPYEEAVLRRAMVAGREMTDVTCIARGGSSMPQTAFAQPVAFRDYQDVRPGVQTRTVAPAPTRVGSRQSEDRRKSDRSWGKTAMVIGGGAGGGAGIGGLIGGKKGALIGAAVGGGAATIYESTKR